MSIILPYYLETPIHKLPLKTGCPNPDYERRTSGFLQTIAPPWKMGRVAVSHSHINECVFICKAYSTIVFIIRLVLEYCFVMWIDSIPCETETHSTDMTRHSFVHEWRSEGKVISFCRPRCRIRSVYFIDWFIRCPGWLVNSTNTHLILSKCWCRWTRMYVYYMPFMCRECTATPLTA